MTQTNAKQWIRDLFALTKPRIVLFCVLMAWGGMVLVPESLTSVSVLSTLFGTAFAVGAANTFNMIIERKSDRLMRRTASRPLAAERLSPKTALVFGVLLCVGSFGILYKDVNALTAYLGLFAIASYSLIYTPMKQRSAASVVIGTVPGAIPPLMGWTAVTNNIDKTGLVLFAILMLWQIPHTLAISLYNKEDYARAGIKTVPFVLGDNVAKTQAIAYSLALLLASLLLVPLGVAGSLYLFVALVLGSWFFIESVKGLRAESTDKWARGLFRVSLFYLPGLTLGLMLDLII